MVIIIRSMVISINYLGHLSLCMMSSQHVAVENLILILLGHKIVYIW